MKKYWARLSLGLAAAICVCVAGWRYLAPAGGGNSIMVLAPYRYNGTWVFDDPAVGLRRELFVAGVPEMIDVLVKEVPAANEGFRLTFSAVPFPGHQKQLSWVRSANGGNYYRFTDSPMEGWLCPALFKYYSTPPKALFVKAEAK